MTLSRRSRAAIVLLVFLLSIILAAVFGSRVGGVTTYKDFAPIASAQAKKHNATPPNVYGWNWDGPVTVCDNTGNPRWDVDGSVAMWAKGGIDVSLVSDCSTANIVVDQGDAAAFCSTNEIIIGCGGTDVGADGEPIHGRVVMNADWADWVYIETLEGGTRHELGHTLGYGHPQGLTNADSVMGIPISANCNPCARTTLSPYDRSMIRYLY